MKLYSPEEVPMPLPAAVRECFPHGGATITIVDPSQPLVIGSGQPCWGLDEPPDDPPPYTPAETRGLDNPEG